MKKRTRSTDPQEAAQEESGWSRPSKSKLKRDMLALQALGEELLALPMAKLRRLPLPENLLDAIELAQRITSREGLRRQRQYIGRLMRDVDAEPIRNALHQDSASHRREVAVMHEAEHWRERLARDPASLDEFIGRHPDLPPPPAALITGAAAEIAGGAYGRHGRELYRHLRDALGAPPPSTVRPESDDE